MERLFDLALGLSVLGWGAAALAGLDSFAPVRIAIAALNFAVGALILLRSTPERHGSLRSWAMALPAVAISGAALHLAPPAEAWALGPTLLLCLGCLFALIAFAFLGRSFAVLPALRRVVARGPYRWIRHPAYAGELAMLAGASWAAGTSLALALIPLALLLTSLRIRAEEAVLVESEIYREYAARVRWRLIPLVW